VEMQIEMETHYCKLHLVTALASTCNYANHFESTGKSTHYNRIQCFQDAESMYNFGMQSYLCGTNL